MEYVLRGGILAASLNYSLAFVCISLRLLFFGALLSSAFPRVAALAYSSRPTLSANAKTRVLTVAPSRRFLLHNISIYQQLKKFLE